MKAYETFFAYFFQRGSAESKDPDKKEVPAENPTSSICQSDAPLPVKKGGIIFKLYSHSLSLSFGLWFAISFVGHAICGAQAHNEDATEHAGKALLRGNIWARLNFGLSRFRIGRVNFWRYFP